MTPTVRQRAASVIQHVSYAWSGITEPVRRDRTPALITLGILFVGMPLLIWRLFHGFTASDFGTVVLTATLIALIWTAHYSYRSVQHARQAEEREEMRRHLTRMSIAVAVGAELDYLQLSLELVGARIETRGVRFLERPQLRHALANLDLFSGVTAGRLSEFDAVLRQIEAQALLYAADHEAAEHAALTHRIGVAGVAALNRNPQWVEDIRRMIAGAQAMIPLLKTQLLEES